MYQLFREYFFIPDFVEILIFILRFLRVPHFFACRLTRDNIFLDSTRLHYANISATETVLFLARTLPRTRSTHVF